MLLVLEKVAFYLEKGQPLELNQLDWSTTLLCLLLREHRLGRRSYKWNLHCKIYRLEDLRKLDRLGVPQDPLLP